MKRFLNDLSVRSSIAERRGIELDVSVVAKLMVLELLLPEDFDMVLGWLARGDLRRQLSRLEKIAGRSFPTEKPDEVEDQEPVEDTSKRPRPKAGTNRPGTSLMTRTARTRTLPTTSSDGRSFYHHSKTLI